MMLEAPAAALIVTSPSAESNRGGVLLVRKPAMPLLPLLLL